MDHRLISARATLAADLAELRLSVTDEQIASQPQLAEELAKLERFQEAQEAEVVRLSHGGSESGMVTVSKSKLKAELERFGRDIWQRAKSSSNTKADRGAHGGGISIIADSVAVPGVERLAEMMQKLDVTLRTPVKPVYDKNGVLVGARRGALPGDLPDGSTPAALEARMAALEQKPHLQYAGIYREDTTYGPGSVCTFNGSMFHCQKKTTDRPGTSDAWVLCVKHGRDLR